MLLCKTPSSGLLPSSLSFSPSQALSVRFPARSRHPRLLLASLAVIFFFLSLFFYFIYFFFLSLCVSSIRLSRFILKVIEFLVAVVTHCSSLLHPSSAPHYQFLLPSLPPFSSTLDPSIYCYQGPVVVGFRIAQVRLGRSLESPPRKTEELARWLYPANQSTPYPGTSFQMS